MKNYSKPILILKEMKLEGILAEGSGSFEGNATVCPYGIESFDKSRCKKKRCEYWIGSGAQGQGAGHSSCALGL